MVFLATAGTFVDRGRVFSLQKNNRSMQKRLSVNASCGHFFGGGGAEVMTREGTERRAQTAANQRRCSPARAGAGPGRGRRRRRPARRGPAGPAPSRSFPRGGGGPRLPPPPPAAVLVAPAGQSLSAAARSRAAAGISARRRGAAGGHRGTVPRRHPVPPSIRPAEPSAETRRSPGSSRCACELAAATARRCSSMTERRAGERPRTGRRQGAGAGGPARPRRC